MKILLFILYIFTYNSLFSQHYNTGIRTNFIYTNNEDEFDKTLNSNYTINDRTFSAEILVEYITSNKDVFYRLRGGIYQALRKQKNINNNPINNSSLIINSKNNFFEKRFAIGIGKYYDLEKVTFKIGVELPLYIRGSYYYSNYTDRYDANGKITSKEKFTTEKPGSYSTGAFFFANVYYNFWKSFSVGIEVTNGFLYSRGKGPASEVQETYDANGNLTKKTITEEKLKRKGFNTSFLSPSVGLSYRF